MGPGTLASHGQQLCPEVHGCAACVPHAQKPVQREALKVLSKYSLAIPVIQTDTAA